MNTQNPMFAKFDQALGVTTPTSSTPQVPKWSDEIGAHEKNTTGSVSPGAGTIRNGISNAIGGIKTVANNVIQGTKDAQKGSLDNLQKDIEGASADIQHAQNNPSALGRIADTGKSLVKSGVSGTWDLASFVLSPLSGLIGGAVASKENSDALAGTKPVQAVANSKTGDAVQAVQDKMDELKQAHPDWYKGVSDAINLAMLAAGGEKAPEAVDQFSKGVSSDVNAVKGGINTVANKTGQVIDAVEKGVSNTVGKATDAITSKATDLKNSIKRTPETNDLQKINEKITPKPTVKQAKLATEQGRKYNGKEATTFKSGTPDQVATSDQQFKSTQTINKLIPDAAKMDEPTLYTTMKEKIGEISKKLKPEMQKVPIKPETIDKMNSDWKEVKAKQDADPYRPSDINLKAQQQDFETRLGDIKDGTMDDIWESAKAYDDSVPDRIKQADSTSSESLQTQHDMWLENRAIMRDAINDMENGLGGTSKSAFSDMRDLYEGQRGIMSKAKINTKVQPSTVEKVIKGSIKRVIPYSIGTHL